MRGVPRGSATPSAGLWGLRRPSDTRSSCIFSSWKDLSERTRRAPPLWTQSKLGGPCPVGKGGSRRRRWLGPRRNELERGKGARPCGRALGGHSGRRNSHRREKRAEYRSLSHGVGTNPDGPIPTCSKDNSFGSAGPTHSYERRLPRESAHRAVPRDLEGT